LVAIVAEHVPNASVLILSLRQLPLISRWGLFDAYDVISVSHLQGMDITQLQHFTESLQRLLMPLNPHLIYYYHADVEGQWRFICGVRGNEWGPVSFQSDEDFVQAGEVWTASQAFVRAAVDAWPIPKLIIQNHDYAWEAYDARIDDFVSESLLSV